MLIKSLLRVFLMLIAGLLSYQASAATKYSASEYEPKIVYQSEAVQRIANPPKAQNSEPPIAQLLIVLMLGGLGAYIYKTKFLNTETKAKVVRANAVAEPVVVSAAPRKRSTATQAKRINKNYKGYRSPRISK